MQYADKHKANTQMETGSLNSIQSV